MGSDSGRGGHSGDDECKGGDTFRRVETKAFRAAAARRFDALCGLRAFRAWRRIPPTLPRPARALFQPPAASPPRYIRQSLMRTNDRIGIIGAGLGGLAAACTLAARGHKVTV